MVDQEKVQEFLNQLSKDGYSNVMGKWESIRFRNESLEYKSWIRKQLLTLFGTHDKQTLRIRWWEFKALQFEKLGLPECLVKDFQDQLVKAQAGERGKQGWFNTLIAATKEARNAPRRR